MKNLMRVLSLFLFLSLVLSVCSPTASVCAADSVTSATKTITDLDDIKVVVPASPQKIACMHCVSPQKIFTLGEGSRIAVMSKQSPWAYKLFPEIKEANTGEKIPTEKMKEMGIDLVLFTPGMHKNTKFRESGISAVCVFTSDKRPMTMNEFFENFERENSLFGDILGTPAKEKSDKYNRYFEKKAKEILAITSKIDKEKKPRVYFGGRGIKMLNTQGKGSYMNWIAEIAGANYLPEKLNDDYATAELEQIKEWKPEVIFLSAYCESTDIVTKDEAWTSLDAVKNDKVYRIPRGVFAWDHASAEAPLLMVYMAKKLHPDLFKNYNMIEEMKTFYSEIYGKTVTDQDAERILTFLLPM